MSRALEAKGMERTESHHHMFRKQFDGVHATLVTRFSHGADQIDDHLGRLMGKQCCLQLKEFWQLVDCPLSEERWDAPCWRSVVEGGRNPFFGN